MAAGTKAIVQAAYAAWRSGDAAALDALCADDFSMAINVPATVHPLGGLTAGKKDSFDRLAVIAEQFEILSYEVRDLIAEGEHAAAQAHLRYVHRPTGERLETTLGHFWTVRGGKIVELIEYHDLDRIKPFSDRIVERID